MSCRHSETQMDNWMDSPQYGLIDNQCECSCSVVVPLKHASNRDPCLLSGVKRALIPTESNKDKYLV